jgi:hypothetical protein
MNDTAPQIVEDVRNRLMRLTGSTRFAMGAQMFESARTLIIASFPKNLTAQEFKQRLYERIYDESLPFK